MVYKAKINNLKVQCKKQFTIMDNASCKLINYFTEVIINLCKKLSILFQSIDRPAK